MPKNATILVAEDDRAFRELLLMALKGAGFETLAATNKLEVLSALQSAHVDLLLLDLRLGIHNGIDILKEAQRLQNLSKPPVLFLTGCSDQNTVREAAKLGVKGYILKQQLNHADLLDRICQCIYSAKPIAPSPKADLCRQLASLADTDSPPTPQVSTRATSGEAQLTKNPLPSTQTDDGSDARDRLRSLQPIMTRAEVFTRAEQGSGLKALSPTVSQLLDMTNRPDYSLEEIARVIKRDPALAMKVLKIANSAVYSRAGKVDSVQKALSRIGLAQIRQLILNISVIDRFSSYSLDEYFNGQLFWEHSIATGLIAAAITRFRNGDAGAIDAAFTAGLLHDIGRIVLSEQLGDAYMRVVESARREQLPLEQVESRMLDCNHTDLMERMLKAWGFPVHLIDPIANHHLSMANIRALSPQRMSEISSLALANRLAHAMLLGSTGNDCQYPTEEFVESLNLEPHALRQIEKSIPDEASEIKYAMFQSGPPTACSDHCQFIRTRIQQSVRALYMSRNPAVDGYRILFERLKDIDDDAPANLAVLYLPDALYSGSLLAKLLQAEAELGLEPLPLIVITPLVGLQLDAKLIDGRTHRILPSPFILPRLIDAMNGLVCPDRLSLVANS